MLVVLITIQTNNVTDFVFVDINKITTLWNPETSLWTVSPISFYINE